MQGRLAEAVEICERAVEVARLSANPHELFCALFELGWAHYFAGDLDGGGGLRGERAPGPRLAGGTIPNGGGGPGGGWAVAGSSAARSSAARAICSRSSATDPER